MKTIIKSALFILGLSLSIAYATPVHPKIKLMSLKTIKQSEKGGDELYLAITVYPSKGRPSQTYFPKQPLYWPSKHIDRIKPTSIWDKRLFDGDGATVIIALIERDTPPWNIDDLVGEVQLKLRNNAKGLDSQWTVLTRGAEGKLSGDGNEHVADLKGPGGHYQLTLKLEQ